MAKLAIKGHPTRGKEIIQLLEMLGGMNKFEDISFITPYIFLFVDDDYYTEIGWDFIGDDNNYEEFVIYTLEEFEEKYPYKVGDVVDYYVGMLLKKETHTIIGMKWDSNKCRILYHLDNGNVLDVRDILYSVEYKTEQSNPKEEKSFPPYMDYDIKEEIMEKNKSPKTQEEVDKYLQEHPIKNAMNVMDIESCLETDGLKLSENVVINSKGIGSIQFIQWYEKQQYPKTYEECCNVIGISRHDVDIDLPQPYQQKMFNIFKLHICRDAYWKIAGEQMGLDKPWEPDWGDYGHNAKFKYTITTIGNNVIRETSNLRNYILVFPTEEMRDAFYDNFKYLIEQCKELL